MTTTATISRSPCQRLGKHLKGKPFESNQALRELGIRTRAVELSVEELKIVFLH